jgi:hypothetical protein
MESYICFFNGMSNSSPVFSSLTRWIKDELNLIRKSNEEWPTVKSRNYKHKN